MRCFDFITQLILIISAAVMAICYPFDHSTAILFLLIQLFLGIWQFCSSLISVSSKGVLWTRKKNHLVISTLYILCLTMCSIGIKGINLNEHVILIYVLWTVPAWTLALYYLYLSYHSAFPSLRKKGSFLRNISF
jgi:hypothetical protein